MRAADRDDTRFIAADDRCQADVSVYFQFTVVASYRQFGFKWLRFLSVRKTILQLR